ncbi:DUF6053 domain-containing protein [Lysobacter enzymogenes]|uniref:DUF6053 domain-containing protein n=1 Tax=Lysobacter enzymogenes TaxID=69 RepID=UPI003748E4DA
MRGASAPTPWFQVAATWLGDVGAEAPLVASLSRKRPSRRSMSAASSAIGCGRRCAASIRAQARAASPAAAASRARA